MYDVIVVGGGPAGLTAAIYTSRAGLSTLVLEKMSLGGQAALTYRIDNYPGFKDIYGAELAADFEEHVRDAGAEIVLEEAVGFDFDKEVKVVRTASNHYETKAVILALGSERRKLGIPGEEKYTGRGVSYCATCDGNFFKNEDIAVVGGGNTAAGYALELADICRTVFLIYHGGELPAMYSLRKRLEKRSNIKVLHNREVREILGSNKVEQILVGNLKSGETETVKLDGVFVAVGMLPNSDLLPKDLLLPNGFIQTDEDGTTALPGVFAAGDLRQKKLYQIVTAMSDGANAAHSTQIYLRDSFEK
ncbi:thioredoxin reductase [Oscillibacter valericigenes Sjm18-20]|nr:thioredoxin reductase [Oscillibacter valericigenes Sjm18-20]